MMRRFKWGQSAIHMAKKEKSANGFYDSICWVSGEKRSLRVTNIPRMVTCKFCLKKLEEMNELDEGKEDT